MNAEKTIAAVADTADDIDITFNAGDEEEPLEEGHYVARLVNFKVEDRPDWKIARDRVQNPDREPDPRQFAFYWELTDEWAEGRKITDWTNRSFHPKSNGGKYAAYLLGKSKLEGNEGMSTRQLLGKTINLYITQNNGKNYCNAGKSTPIRASRKRSVVNPDEEIEF